MSSCIELEGPWREALGTTGRLSECRVIRNPSFSLCCVNGPAASIWTSPEEGSPPSGWNWIVHKGGALWELSAGGEGRSYVFLFIDSAAEITKLFQGRIKFGGVFPISTAGIRGVTSYLHKSLKWLWRTQLEKYLTPTSCRLFMSFGLFFCALIL